MSKELKQKVIVTDSRLLENKLHQPVLQGCDTILYKQWLGDATASSIHFTCPTPSNNCEIDRNINLLVPVRLTFSMADVPYGTFLLNPDLCNLRSFPIHKAMSQMRLTLNSNTVTINNAEIFSALEHFSTSAKLKNLEYSKCSTYGACQVQAFNDIPNGSRSELATYASSIAGVAPQTYPFTVVSQTTRANPLDVATAVVDFQSIESLMVSPCYFGDARDNTQAFVGVKTLDLHIDFQQNHGFRMFAIDPDDSTIPLGTGAITVTSQFSFVASDNFSYPDLQPKLLIQYLQAQVQHKAGKVFEYPYYQIDNYITAHTASVASLAAPVVISSNEVTLPRLPSKIFIFARKPQSTFITNPFTPDSFMSIENIAVRWNNRLCLSTAHKTQLYDISIKNGVDLDYAAWSGLGINFAIPAAAANGFGSASVGQYRATGGIVCLDPLDLGLSDDMTQHPENQISIQVNATVKNISYDAFVPVLCIATLTDGVMTIADGIVTTKLGIMDTVLKTPIYDKDPTNIPMGVAKRGLGSLGLHNISLKHLFRRK